ncbi:hypothetical protein F5X99DRAFT_344719 [Biscogniauxia marginata]|nr:hypothetical protein F5X99DRAFT_344719 [Biscogniauxia marginata]
MNRFRTKKRGKDEAGAPRPSQESESSMPFRPFRKGKKAQENEKVELDLSTALPPSDDFRTSLLMTGLSARFSMLREQDDPSTKIGKASDDSVLHPKRQSRLDYGAFRGLGDIAEVESVKAPFARIDSFNSSDDTDSVNAGSVLGRSKPIEGNNLFGGRQKIYKIPVGANSAKSIGGGMGGRALYDDDVALSAFQRWRQAEKERKSLEGGRDDSEERRLSGDMESELPRSESPSLGSYDRKRETSSTTSSIPSQARNSTAATSVTSSHRAPSLKDWQSSTSAGPSLERSMTRTRRLYETGLHNDLHEQQSSAMFRIDTLTRQRTFGTRTPDLPLNSPSPTTTTFVERFGGERKILAKASASNLRSASPSATSPAGTPDLGIRVPNNGEGRPNFGGAPPLSPPISEAGELSMLPIGPDDRGKATALGVFQRPSQPYDESKYAQRQIQLQQGRETPTFRMHDERKTSITRSRSSSSTRRQPIESKTNSPHAVAPQLSKEGISSTSFLADADAEDSEASPAASPRTAPSPQMVLRRPSDRDHPAFRDSAMPTPLSGFAKPDDELFLVADTPSSVPESKDISPVDSPTLGPTTGAGLSGMVRQHLRAASNASSIYGPYSTVPPTADLESRFPTNPVGARDLQDLAADANPWDGRDWNLDIDVNEPIPEIEPVSPQYRNNVHTEPILSSIRRESRDEFASQLADGARRIRERLTTYVETDSRSSSPPRAEEQDEPMNLPLSSRSNGLGILRSKGSRGSLMDRSREPSQTKAMKMLGFSGNNPQANIPSRELIRDGGENELRQMDLSESGNQTTTGAEEPHAGLRAFRQAKRELQRLKEVETQAKHQQPLQKSSSEMPSQRSTPSRERPTGPTIRAPSGERQPPPAYYRQRGPGEESRRNIPHPDTRSSSRAERDRSGSDSSNEARSNSRPQRPRGGLRAPENVRLGPTTTAPRPQLRSPGLPGTDIKHSPIMPPQLHPNVTAKMNQLGFAANGQPHSQHARGNDLGMPSPVSPMPSPFMKPGHSAPGLPASPRRPSVPHNASHDGASPTIPGLNDAMRRRVKTKDISEPTFVMSTSRVPTVSLPPEAARNRSQSNSRSAPPLPPINPRRRQDGSRTRTIMDTMSRFRADDIHEGASASMPNLPLDGSTGNAGHTDEGGRSDEDDSKPERRRLRKFHPEGENTSPMIRANNALPINVGPPASRMVVTQGRDRSSNVGMPGGMI